MAIDPKIRAKLDNERKLDRQMVKGIFKNFECPGGVLQFSFKKYKEDQVENYTFYDNKIYTVPRAVAKHLNNNCWYPEYEYMKGEDTQNIYGIKKKVKRFGFQSLEFMDLDDHADIGGQQLVVEATKL